MFINKCPLESDQMLNMLNNRVTKWRLYHGMNVHGKGHGVTFILSYTPPPSPALLPSDPITCFTSSLLCAAKALYKYCKLPAQ